MSRPSVPPDPYLLQAAAHELGHAVVNTAYGIPVLSVDITPTGAGLTRTDFDDTTCTPTQLRHALIATLAGYEAERRWCLRHGGHADRACSATDVTNFLRNCHRVALTGSVARAHARAVLACHWPRIERLAPHLARAGHVQPWS